MKFIAPEYLVESLLDCDVQKKNIIVIRTGKWYDVNLFKCMLQEIPHDVPNVAIHIEKDGEKLIYATDTNSLENVTAKNYNYYLIEGNYKEEELQQRKEEHIKNGEFVIENRIENSHLSYEQCMKYFMENCADYSVLEVMHQHKDNDTN